MINSELAQHKVNNNELDQQKVNDSQLDQQKVIDSQQDQQKAQKRRSSLSCGLRSGLVA